MNDNYENQDNNFSIEEEETRSPFVIDKHLIITSFKQSFKWIVLCTFFALLISAIIVQIKVKPVYKANCRIIRMQKNISTPTDMPYLYNAFDINTILETAGTKRIVNNIIDELGLDGFENDDIARIINIQRGNRSNVLNFSAQSEDPEFAVELANALGREFIKNNTYLQNSSADSVFAYYNNQRAITMKKIVDLEKELQIFRNEFNIISMDFEKEQLFKKLNLLEVKKIETQMTLKEMNIKINDINQKVSVLPPDVELSRSYQESDASKLARLKNDLIEVRAKYTDINPKVINIKDEISKLEKKISDPNYMKEPPSIVNWGPNNTIEVLSIEKSRYEGELLAAKSNLLNITQKINSIRSELKDYNNISGRHIEITRQIDLQHDLLRIIEGRIAESKMALETNTSDFRIFEPATIPKYPISMSKKVILLALAMVFGFIFSLFFVGKELMDFRIKSTLDYEQYINIPLIGVIPAEEGADPNKFYANIQLILDNIYEITDKADKTPVISIGSVVPETGKSFFINEMTRLVSKNNKILLIECVDELTFDIEDYDINTSLNENVMFKIQHETNNIDKCYFWLSEQIFKRMYTYEDFLKLYEKVSDYDYIIWELFESKFNTQLFKAIARSSSMTILLERFRHTPKIDEYNLVNYLTIKEVENIYGILNAVPNEYYNEDL